MRSSASRSTLDDELRAVVTRARPSPEEIVSLWPTDRRTQIAVLIRVEASGEVRISARLRERDSVATTTRSRTRPSAGSQDGIPVTFELCDGRRFVVPLCSLE